MESGRRFARDFDDGIGYFIGKRARFIKQLRGDRDIRSRGYPCYNCYFRRTLFGRDRCQRFAAARPRDAFARRR